jgi:uncharacterized protein
MRNPLPECIVPGPLAASGETISGIWPADRCERFAEAVHRVTSDIAVELVLNALASGQFDMRGTIKTQVELLCQRCLQPFSWPVDEPFQLRVVSANVTDSVTDDVDLLELDEFGNINLKVWLEDELLLKLPLAAAHTDEQQCDSGMLSRAKEYTDSNRISDKQERSRQNPFAALKDLQD